MKPRNSGLPGGQPHITEGRTGSAGADMKAGVISTRRWRRRKEKCIKEGRWEICRKCGLRWNVSLQAEKMKRYTCPWCALGEDGKVKGKLKERGGFTDFYG